MNFKTFFKYFFLFSVLITIISFGNAQSQSDPFLEILQTELNRNMEILGSAEEPVYLLSYRVDDNKVHNIKAVFGDLDYSSTSRTRTLTIQVRVGSYELDNYRELREKSDYTARRTIILPVTDDNKAIAQIIWRETNIAYKEAIRRLEIVKANVAVKIESEDKAPSYSAAPVSVYFEPPYTDDEFEKKVWQERVRRHSALFAPEKLIAEGDARLQYKIERKYFVNSEGTSIVQNQTYAHLYISGKTIADDGMDLPLNLTYFAHKPSLLENENIVNEEIQELIKTLIRLRVAPIADAYTGPALLSPKAAGIFFHEIFGHRVEGQRLKKEGDAQTFKKKLGEVVLDTSISVSFDPTIAYYKEIPLNGSYKFDDEGVEGKRVNVVENGYLRNFLMTRTPIDNIPESNGHARAQASYQPSSRQSNLIVETSTAYSDEELRKLLREEAVRQGKEYGYLFEKVVGGFTQTGRYLPNSFNIKPVEVYRIYVDGRPDELVRGVDLVGTPLAMFAQIGGAGRTAENFAGYCGAESGRIPAGCCSPAFFVKKIETQRKEKSQSRPPIVERYTDDTTSFADFEATINAAMQDEINKNLELLKLEGLEDPYFVSYLVSDAKVTTVKSSLGGVIHSFSRPYRTHETKVFVGDHQRNNLNFAGGISTPKYNMTLPMDNGYSTIRHRLSCSTDATYKSSAEIFENKKAAIQQQNIPEDLLSLPDYAEVTPKTILLNTAKEEIQLSSLKELSIKLSKIFESYPTFTNSGVEIHAFQTDAYYLSSEGMKYCIPFSLIGLRVYAETIAEDGEALMNYFSLYTNRFDELPNDKELAKMTKEMAELLETIRQAPVMNKSYSGPVMFVGNAVGEIVGRLFVENNNGLIARRKPILSDPSSLYRYGIPDFSENTLEDMIGKKMISRDLSITLHDQKTHFGGIPLIGHFQYDADGITPEPELTLINQGVLQNMIKDRVPTPEFASPNGNNRLALSNGGLTTSVAPGVMELTGKTKMSIEKLKKKLISMAKEEDYEYAYIVTQIVATTSSLPNSTKYQTKNGFYHPIYVIRINVKDGSETILRAAKVSTVNMKSFKQIVAVSNEQQVYNTLLYGSNKKLQRFGNHLLYGVPVSLIVPTAILFSDLDVKKDETVEHQKLPLVENPF